MTLKRCQEIRDNSEAPEYWEPRDDESYMPSNGTELLDFMDRFCDRCQCPDELAWNENQEGSGCEHIITITAKDEQPGPWVVRDGKPCCLEFRK